MKMLPVQLEIKPEGDHWLARCAALDVMTQGKTSDEAMYNLNDALFLFVESCLRRGVWNQVLKFESSQRQIGRVAPATDC